MTPESVTIVSDSGGDIDSYIAFAESDKFQLRITGMCQSSCTMFLSAKRVCVTPDAMFGFHGPILWGMGSGPLSAQKLEAKTRELERLVDDMTRHLPVPLNQMFFSDWSQSLEMTWLTGTQVMSLVPSILACGGDGE